MTLQQIVPLAILYVIGATGTLIHACARIHEYHELYPQQRQRRDWLLPLVAALTWPLFLAAVAVVAIRQPGGD